MLDLLLLTLLATAPLETVQPFGCTQLDVVTGTCPTDGDEVVIGGNEDPWVTGRI